MQPRTVIIVACALLSGGAAAVGVNVMVGGDRASSAQESVIVTVADIPRGQTITEEQVRSRPYPKDLLPPGAMTKIEDVVGRASLGPMVKDEPVLEAKLAPKGAGRGLAALIPNGMRAIAIQTPNVATGVAGFILPGNRVDVLMTPQNTGPDDKLGATITLVENVEVLAVDQKVEVPAENKMDVKEMRSVTLLVSPSQATKLSLALSKGTLHLSLRNAADTESAPAASTSVAELKGQPSMTWDERFKGLIAEVSKAMTQQRKAAQKAVTKRPRQNWSIRTLKGTHEGVLRYETTDSSGF
jgi:pilus assembly protein CpaB